MINEDPLTVSVSEFVSLFNQTLEYAYPSIAIEGELANFRISKNKWVYFDLKDELSSVKFFGTVYQLPGPLEDGMMLRVKGSPRLHNQYGFSVTVQSLAPIGEGTIKRAAALLEVKLAKEGLFSPERKRVLPYPPKRIGLIASGESAAYHDFLKILNARWSGVEVFHIDTQVQGEIAPKQLINALDYLNTHVEVDVIVMTRGGGSPEDLAAFSTEQVTRAVAASRTVTLVAIGHEVDVSLAELAADQRASTPSNAAELLVPDKTNELEKLKQKTDNLHHFVSQHCTLAQNQYADTKKVLEEQLRHVLATAQDAFQAKYQLLHAYNPRLALQRGFAIARAGSKLIRSTEDIQVDQLINVELADGSLNAAVTSIKKV